MEGGRKWREGDKRKVARRKRRQEGREREWKTRKEEI